MSNQPTLLNLPIKSRRVVLHNYKDNRRQSGVALLTILLLVVVITVLVGSMVASQRLSIRQYELLLTQDQILQNIKVAEQMATALIVADSKVNDHDSMQDVWAKPLAPATYGKHNINITIKDASAQFNLNNLYHNGAVDELAVAVFKRLLDQAGLESNLAYAVLDWQDPDSETSADGGAEMDAYKSKQGTIASSQASTDGQAVTSTIGNQPFFSTDELMSVKGFTPAKFRQIQPYITAIPYYLPINVNTASPVVLSALVEGINSEQFSDFEAQMRTTPATDVANVLQQAPWSTFSEEQLAEVKPLLAVSSQAFRVLIDITVEDKHRYATSLVSKTSKQQRSSNQEEATEKLSNQVEDNTELKIASFGTRLWTYRPNF